MYRHGGVPFQFVSVVDFGPFAVRASAFNAVGRLDEGMAQPGECGVFTDFELSLRLWVSVRCDADACCTPTDICPCLFESSSCAAPSRRAGRWRT